MTHLETIRTYHDTPDNFTEITIKGNLFEVGSYAKLERLYGHFLRTQIEYFPYILKGQWRTFYGKSRGTGHNAINDLVEMKLLGEESFKGCHYVFPITRAMKWYTDDEKAKPMKPKLSNNILLDHFMRAEYFLIHGNPIQVSPDVFFNQMLWDRTKLAQKKKELIDLNGEIKNANLESQKIQQKVNETNEGGECFLLGRQLGQLETRLNDYKIRQQKIEEEIQILEQSFPPLQLPDIAEGGAEILAEEWKDRKIFGGEKFVFKNKLDYFRFIQKCLSILPDRNCYFDNIQMNKDRFRVDLVMIHYHDSSKARYHNLIQDMNMICNCFINGVFTIRVLCESEKDQQRADKVLKEVFRQRKKGHHESMNHYKSRENLCQKFICSNTNIVRYFQKGDTDLLVHEADLKDLETIIESLKINS